MHELSIAQAILQVVRENVSARQSVRRVAVRVGPLQAIERRSMDLAWTAATMDGFCAGAELELELIPWTLRCPACGRQWSADDPLQRCSCGSMEALPSGSAELTLLWVEVDSTAAADLVDDDAISPDEHLAAAAKRSDGG